MGLPDAIVEIQTFGRFRISSNGKTVTTDWPDETLKVFFCSLLSPLDLNFTWDRICRAMWETTATPSSRRYLKDTIIQPLNSFLIKELSFTPLVTGDEGIRIDHQHIRVDAFEFYNAVIEGLRLMSFTNNTEALQKLSRAKALYVGSYLPGMPGKIIESTRKDLDSLYRFTNKGPIP